MHRLFRAVVRSIDHLIVRKRSVGIMIENLAAVPLHYAVLDVFNLSLCMYTFFFFFPVASFLFVFLPVISLFFCLFSFTPVSLFDCLARLQYRWRICLPPICPKICTYEVRTPKTTLPHLALTSIKTGSYHSRPAMIFCFCFYSLSPPPPPPHHPAPAKKKSRNLWTNPQPMFHRSSCRMYLPCKKVMRFLRSRCITRAKKGQLVAALRERLRAMSPTEAVSPGDEEALRGLEKVRESVKGHLCVLRNRLGSWAVCPKNQVIWDGAIRRF